MIIPKNYSDNLFRLDRKVAIVTGASRGIGEAIACGFSLAGAKVVLASRSEKKINKISNDIINHGGDSLAIKTDVTNYTDLKYLLNESVSNFGKVDILVNCAGVAFGMESQDYKKDFWDKTYKTNLKSVFDLCQIVAKNMITNNGGSIINITSIAAVLASPNNPAYNATKGGLKQLSKAFAADWAKYNIRVNNLGPGYFNTELNKSSWEDPELRNIRAQRSLLNRWGEPHEIIGPAIFLASDASSFMTGQDIYIDGGFLAKSL